LRERAVIIIVLHPQLEKLADGATGAAKTEAQKLVDGFTAPNSAHTNCARSYRDLFQNNRAEAKAVFEQASKLITSIS
jgi:aromatic ring hydroxylase